MTETRALALLSGGIDSAVALYWAVARGWEVHALEFEYHLRPARERDACLALREHAGVAGSVLVPMGFLRETEDIVPSLRLNDALIGAPQGYIPARNLVFYALSSHYAEILGARYIVGGHNRSDAERFPDAGREFFSKMNRLLHLGLWSHGTVRTEIELPLIAMDKVGVLRLGRDLGVPFAMTWSCYHDGQFPCGRCPSCEERRTAFGKAGMPDPLADGA